MTQPYTFHAGEATVLAAEGQATDAMPEILIGRSPTFRNGISQDTDSYWYASPNSHGETIRLDLAGIAPKASAVDSAIESMMRQSVKKKGTHLLPDGSPCIYFAKR